MQGTGLKEFGEKGDAFRGCLDGAVWFRLETQMNLAARACLQVRQCAVEIDKVSPAMQTIDNSNRSPMPPDDTVIG